MNAIALLSKTLGIDEYDAKQLYEKVFKAAMEDDYGGIEVDLFCEAIEWLRENRFVIYSLNTKYGT